MANDEDLKEVADVARVTLAAVRAQASVDHDILVRLEEKVTAIHSRLDDFQKNLENHEKSDTVTFVTKESFDPVRNLVYGMVGVIGIAVVGAVLKLVFIK